MAARVRSPTLPVSRSVARESALTQYADAFMCFPAIPSTEMSNTALQHGNVDRPAPVAASTPTSAETQWILFSTLRQSLMTSKFR